MITEEQTEGVRFAWGDYAAYQEALARLVEQPNEFYAAIARGSDFAAGKYGGQEFSIAFGGNEMPGYHTGRQPISAILPEPVTVILMAADMVSTRK